jgi:hypothetical protein
MDKWLLKLRDSHAVATVLIGVGVDDKEGQAVICTLENLDTDDLVVILRETLRLLESPNSGDDLPLVTRPPID